MKKILAIVFLAFTTLACDDGDVQVDTITFDDVAAAKCSGNEIVYKLNDNQVLLLKLDPAANPFENNPDVRTFAIDASNEVRYRLYNGTLDVSNICSIIQPATPVITEEWIATSGTVEITTTQVLSNPDALTNATRINHYNHNVILRNITFAKPTGNQFYEVFSFGDYRTSAATLAFDFEPEDVKLCASTNTLYNVKVLGREGLYIKNFDDALFATDAPNLNVPKTAPLSETSNQLFYRLFKSQLAGDAAQGYFCDAAAGPETDQEWIGVGGIIEVITTTEGTGFRHTIRLKYVTFIKGNGYFYYGDDILYGELLTE